MHNKNHEGWDILLALPKGHLVKLGARPTRDLNAERVAIQLHPGETYHCLNERCNLLSQEYISESQESIHSCPCIKLLEKFVTELMCSSTYALYLLNFESRLICHSEDHDTSDYSIPLPF